MLSGEKILVTGPAGQVAFPLARYLAANNEVWGVSRFGDEAARQRVEEAGIITRSFDLGRGELGHLDKLLPMGVICILPRGVPPGVRR